MWSWLQRRTLRTTKRSDSRRRISPGENLEPRVMLFKPYTHVMLSEEAWQDVTDDAQITIENVDYDVNASLVQALRNHKPAFNAGAIGPDSFPDIAYGQSVIHGKNTGMWLDHVLTSAWDAQSDSS